MIDYGKEGICADEVLEFSGIDIRQELKDGDNVSDKSDAFLLRMKTRVDAFVERYWFLRVPATFQRFNERMKRHYKLALLEQAVYVLRNGDISTDSGYDPEKGKVADPDYLKAISVAPNAIDHIIQMGFGRQVGGRLDGPWWLF